MLKSQRWNFSPFSIAFLIITIIITQTGFTSASEKDVNMSHLQECAPGLIFPVWEPQTHLTGGQRALRGVVYFLTMIYMFLGVSIVSDRFMAAIEVITSREKEVKIKKANGEVQLVVVKIWNETVANLTLMALGSSAPEILLSIIEIMGAKFEAGELGPGTIVGSAAFNLLIIIGLCVVVIPDGEIRRIKHLRVFFVTAVFSVFAYIWLLVILKWSSEGVVEFWEALVTFLCFPLTVILAYTADRRFFVHKLLKKTYRANKRGLIIEGEGGGSGTDLGKSDTDIKPFEGESENLAEFEQNRRDYIRVLQDLRKKNPNLTPEKLEELAREEIIANGPKSRGFYRMQATRKLVGGQNLVKKMQGKAAEKSNAELLREKAAKTPQITASALLREERTTLVYFDPAHYTILENIGKFQVTVVRSGGNLDKAALVDYQTEDGTATAGQDYYAVIGTLAFEPGEILKTITLEVIDDEDFEEDEHFYLRLSKPRFGTITSPGVQSPTKKKEGKLSIPTKTTVTEDEYFIKLTSPFLATVMILDDDHGGIFNFTEKEIDITETSGVLDIKVSRWSGARGKVSLKYATSDGNAKAGVDYEETKGMITFGNNELEQMIKIPIIDTDAYEKDVTFHLDISEPILLEENNHRLLELMQRNPKTLTKDEKIALEGVPRLGNDRRVTIHIKESKEFKTAVDRLVLQTNTSDFIGTSSWREQFREAFQIEGDDDDEDGIPGLGTYIFHFLTLFWKVSFSIIPPTDCCGGYLAFVCSILAIGVLTAAIGDIASAFGCSVGLKDSVTAIVFVALGTSIPDTFASKVAACQDEFADASIGNVTGSNAVNVFLGIGIAWTLAAIYHNFIKCSGLPANACVREFKVDPGSLGFSVSLFCGCAFVAIILMLLRRLEIFGGGELGGPRRFKIPTGILFLSLWLFYIIMSSLESYGHIQGF